MKYWSNLNTTIVPLFSSLKEVFTCWYEWKALPAWKNSFRFTLVNEKLDKEFFCNIQFS